jgi:hypothetical protein
MDWIDSNTYFQYFGLGIALISAVTLIAVSYRILTDYFDYDHNSRCRLSLVRNSPTPREVKPPSQGEVVATGYYITDTRVLRNRKHWLAWLVHRYRSACDGKTSRFPIPGFFAAIFSVVPQFDLCPVDWYNRQMEFLGRTPAKVCKPVAEAAGPIIRPEWTKYDGEQGIGRKEETPKQGNCSRHET